MDPCTLRLTIGEATVRRVVESEFGVWNDHAAEMHKALVTPEKRIPSSLGALAVVRAAPEAWDTLRRWCELRSLLPSNAGVVEQREGAVYARTQRRIHKELDKLARHPGFRGVAVPGISTVLLLGRRLDPDDRWWPTIRHAMDATDLRDGLQTAELWPTEVYNRGILFTTWKPRPV